MGIASGRQEGRWVGKGFGLGMRCCGGDGPVMVSTSRCVAGGRTVRAKVPLLKTCTLSCHVLGVFSCESSANCLVPELMMTFYF